MEHEDSQGARANVRAKPTASIVVWGALAANVGIATAKYLAAGISGSSALLSEAIHSTADTGNGLLLVLGVYLSRKPPDANHPFGRGQEIYFWGLIVAVVLFGLGGGLSLYEGIQHVASPHPITDPTWNYVVLACAFAFEGASLTVAVHTIRQAAKERGIAFWSAVHRSKNPEHFVVMFEDSAALIGVVVAFGGVYASHALRLPAVDGMASIVIGVILAIAAMFLAYECRSLLLGEAADPDLVAAISRVVGADPDVCRVGPPLTMHLSPEEILLNLEIEIRDDLAAPSIPGVIARIEDAVRAAHPEVGRIFVEITSLRRDPAAEGNRRAGQR